MRINSLPMEFAEKNKTDIDVVVEWMVEKIAKESAEEAVDLFLQLSSRTCLHNYDIFSQ